MYGLLVGIQLISILVLISAIVFIFQGGATDSKRLMLAFMAAELVHNTGFLFELMAKTKEAAMVAIKVEYLGSSIVAIVFMMFIFVYCDTKRHQAFSRFLLLCGVAVIAMVWSGDYHNLYYKEVDYVQTGIFPHVKLTYGPGFYFYFLFCVIIPWGAAVCVLIKSIRKEKSAKRIRKLWTIIGGGIFAFSMLGVYLLNLFPAGYDPTPASMAMMFSVLVFLLWNNKDFDLTKTAAQTVFNSLGSCMITLDENLRVMMYNREAKKLFPTLKELEPISRVENFPTQILEKGKEKSFQFEDRYYEGEVHAVTDYEDLVRGYTISVTDVTATYEHIRELEDMRQCAEEANQAKTDFLANMSHEIRTPMNTIVGMSDVLMEEQDGNKIKDYARDIKTAAWNLLTIINDILDLSKVEAGKMELVEEVYEIKSLASDLEKMFEVVVKKKGLELQIELAENVPERVNGDMGRIRQILINLINNAIKFTNEGYIKLSVSAEKTEEDSVLLRFEVKDTGIGIKPEDLEVIFESFRQADMKRNRKNEGTGLGLTISKQLTHLMGGEISLQSEYGKGTTFTVRIKQGRVEEKQPAEQEKEKINKAGVTFTAPGYRILIVDDNAVNRKVAKAMLKYYNVEIDEAESGKQAIEYVCNKAYDMILMDHMMPQMDGMEATKIIRNDCGEKGETVTIVAVTANVLQGAQEMYIQNGFDDFLSKPFDRRLLDELLDKWIPKEIRG